jgi:DNA modification methylase
MGIFDNFSPELYTIWNFAKATNDVRHFGNIPPEIAENLLYYYTKPFDVVFDPFGGGGSTLDVCQKRERRCYISDLNPIPARENDIRKHDISTGLPDDLPVPDLVFLDPPYWQQAKEKYSTDATDLANIELEPFLDSIGAIARDIKTKWRKSKRECGTLALIIGPCKEDGKKIDLPLLCYERISKYLTLSERVIVPYSTQVHGGAYVNMAKQRKELLYLHRDLMVFQWHS